MNPYVRKCAAIVLVLLIVTPFTAPFSICTIAEFAAAQRDTTGASLSVLPLAMSAPDDAKSIVDVAYVVSTMLAPPADDREGNVADRPLTAIRVAPLILRI